MQNKKKYRIREELIPIVMTLIFVLGFFLIQTGGITGLAVLETNSIQTFEVNEVIPATATLEITSGTQQAQILLSEFTIKLHELANIQPILENNKLVAYNITNITIDLASYNIEPVENITIRFVEVYKEITKEITKEIISVVEENITEIPEEIPEVKKAITFDRSVTCDKCGQHKAPPLTYVTITVSATSETLLDTTFADYIPVEWIVINPYGGEVEYIGNGYKKITWNVENITEISKTYIVQSPKLTTPPTDYTFKSELANITSDPWTIKVADPTIEFETEESNFTIQAFIDNSAPTVSDNSIPVDDTTVITVQYYSQGGTIGALWLTEDTKVINNVAAGSDFYCANGAADIDVSSCACTTCTPNADCTVTMDCDNKADGTIDFTVTAAGNDESPLPTQHTFRGGSDVGTFDLDSEIVTIEAGADTTAPKVENRYPYNNTNWTTPYINFSYNVTDAGSEIGQCILWLKKAGTWELNSTNTTIVEGIKNNTMNVTFEDSSVLWKVECNDSSTNQDNRGNSTTFNITIDTTAPKVENRYPYNNTNWTTPYINFTFNITDNLIGIDSCDLWLKKGATWEWNKTESVITEGIKNNTLNITLEDSSVLWKVECNDTLNNRGNSTTYNITIDSHPPTVENLIPKNDTQGYVHSVNFTYNVTDYSNVTNCSLYLKHSYAGSWERNKTDEGIETLQNQTLNLTLLHENVYWKVGCYDRFAQQGNSTTFNYTVLIAQPTVNRSLPKNNTQFINAHKINFTYNVTVPGPETPQACQLYIDGALNSTDYDIEEEINQSFNITFDFGTYKWQIGCNSSDGWGDNTTTYNFSTAEVLNVAPEICCKRAYAGSADSQTINLDSWRSISVCFNVTDADGPDNLKAFANFTGTGDDDGTNTYTDYNITCEYTGKSNATSKEFNCSTKIWYFFKPGYWNISVNATDSALWTSYDNMSNVDLAQTKAITISPTSLTWPTVNVGTWNQTSNNDPITINNTGNYNVSLGYVNVTAYDLHGEASGYESQEIPAANFTVDIETGGTCSGAACIECDGTAMANATSINIANSILPLGNHSITDGKTAEENISICLINVPFSNMITPGISYSTANSKQWIIGIS